MERNNKGNKRGCIKSDERTISRTEVGENMISAMERYPCYNMNDVRNNYGAIKVINDAYSKAKMEKPKDLLDAYKRGIRDYFKRKDTELERRAIYACYDEYIELLQLPEEVASLENAKAWFDANELRVCRPSMFDCTGQKFTGGTTFVERNGRWWVYHTVYLDV